MRQEILAPQQVPPNNQEHCATNPTQQLGRNPFFGPCGSMAWNDGMMVNDGDT